MFSFRDTVLSCKNVISKIMRKKHITYQKQMKVTMSTFMPNLKVELSAGPKTQTIIKFDNGHY
jgi:hypothetical protein